MATKSSITIELTPVIIEELTSIVQHLGFDSPEVLVKNYLKEVIIAARIEQATAQTRHSIITSSKDLNPLSPQQK